MRRAICLGLLLFCARTALAEAQPILTLDAALEAARKHHPDLQQARAGTEAGKARADMSRAPLLPQVSGNASYKRSTANFAPSPGSSPKGLGAATSSFDMVNYYALGASASQLLYDFGQTSGRWEAAKASALAAGDSERGALVRVMAGVRTAYCTVQAQKALLQVAQDTLHNREKHLEQVQAFVEVGRRPAIDLAQARSDRATAEVQRISAEANYETAKALLLGAMGTPGDTDFEPAPASLEALPSEDLKQQALLEQALATRPETAGLQHQLQAQDRSIAALRGTYAPSVLLSTGLSDAGQQLSNMAWNWQATLGLSWPVFQGGLSDAQLREARANRAAIEAQMAGLRVRVRMEVEQARLAVRASRAGLTAAQEALDNAKVRLDLAEGRYKAGAGSIIELADAQLAATTAAAQRVQADFKLATARAQLMQALGQP